MPTSPRRSSLQICAHHGIGNRALSIGFHIPSCSLFLFPRHTKPVPTIGLNFPLFPLSVLCLIAQSCPTLCSPMDCDPPHSSALGSPGKNTGVGCHALLQGFLYLLKSYLSSEEPPISLKQHPSHTLEMFCVTLPSFIPSSLP